MTAPLAALRRRHTVLLIANSDATVQAVSHLYYFIIKEPSLINTN